MEEKVYRLMPIEEIVFKLQDRNLARVARIIGIDPRTLARLNSNSTYDVVSRVCKYLQDFE